MKENKRIISIILSFIIIVFSCFMINHFYQQYLQNKNIAKEKTLDNLFINFKKNEHNIIIRRIEYDHQEIDLNDYVLEHNGELEIIPNKLDISKIGKVTIKYILKDKSEFNDEVKKEILKDFIVVDSKKPIIEIKEEKIIIKENEEIDLLNNIKVYDEVDGNLEYSKELKNNTFIIEEELDNKKIGEYEIKILAKDINGNENNAGFIIEVIEDKTKEKEEVIEEKEKEEEKQEEKKEEPKQEEKQKEDNKEEPKQEEKKEEKPIDDKKEEEKPVENKEEEKQEENKEEEIIIEEEDAPFGCSADYEYEGRKLTKAAGVIQGPSGKETYYNLKMDFVVAMMRDLGFSEEDYPYWIREDGAKMLGPYVMVAADFSIRPKGTILPSSLGCAIVVDTGTFTATNQYQLDIAVDW